MSTVQLTQPTEEPVAIYEARTHLRIDDTDSDLYIDALITAARERAESYTGLSFVSRSFGIYLDKFPSGEFRLGCAPLVSVESIKYYDAANTEQTLNASEYYVDSRSRPGRITPVNTWPATYSRPNAISIIATAGYGTAGNVPKTIKQAMLLMIGDMYENREETTGGRISMLPITSELLLRPFRLLG